MEDYLDTVFRYESSPPTYDPFLNSDNERTLFDRFTNFPVDKALPLSSRDVKSIVNKRLCHDVETNPGELRLLRTQPRRPRFRSAYAPKTQESMRSWMFKRLRNVQALDPENLPFGNTGLFTYYEPVRVGTYLKPRTIMSGAKRPYRDAILAPKGRRTSYFSKLFMLLEKDDSCLRVETIAYENGVLVISIHKDRGVRRFYPVVTESIIKICSDFSYFCDNRRVSLDLGLNNSVLSLSYYGTLCLDGREAGKRLSAPYDLVEIQAGLPISVSVDSDSFNSVLEQLGSFCDKKITEPLREVASQIDGALKSPKSDFAGFATDTIVDGVFGYLKKNALRFGTMVLAVVLGLLIIYYSSKGLCSLVRMIIKQCSSSGLVNPQSGTLLTEMVDCFSGPEVIELQSGGLASRSCLMFFGMLIFTGGFGLTSLDIMKSNTLSRFLNGLKSYKTVTSDFDHVVTDVCSVLGDFCDWLNEEWGFELFKDLFPSRSFDVKLSKAMSRLTTDMVDPNNDREKIADEVRNWKTTLGVEMTKVDVAKNKDRLTFLRNCKVQIEDMLKVLPETSLNRISAELVLAQKDYEFCNKKIAEGAVNDIEVWRLVQSNIVVLSRMFQDTMFQKADKENHTVAFNYLNLFRGFSTRIASKNPNARGFKPVAYALYICGKSGAGKNTLVQNIINCAIHRFGSDYMRERFQENYSSVVYNWVMEAEFHDGYCNQPICLLDELFQVDPKVTPDPTYMTVLRLINTNETEVNMAACGAKDAVKFNSSMILGCGNAVGNHFWKGIMENKAPTRRFTSLIQIPNFRRKNVDGTKLEHATNASYREFLVSRRYQDLEYKPLPYCDPDEASFDPDRSLWLEWDLNANSGGGGPKEGEVKLMDFNEVMSFIMAGYDDCQRSGRAKLAHVAAVNQELLKVDYTNTPDPDYAAIYRNTKVNLRQKNATIIRESGLSGIYDYVTNLVKSMTDRSESSPRKKTFMVEKRYEMVTQLVKSSQGQILDNGRPGEILARILGLLSFTAAERVEAQNGSSIRSKMCTVPGFERERSVDEYDLNEDQKSIMRNLKTIYIKCPDLRGQIHDFVRTHDEIHVDLFSTLIKNFIERGVVDDAVVVALENFEELRPTGFRLDSDLGWFELFFKKFKQILLFLGSKALLTAKTFLSVVSEVWLGTCLIGALGSFTIANYISDTLFAKPLFKFGDYSYDLTTYIKHYAYNSVAIVATASRGFFSGVYHAFLCLPDWVKWTTLGGAVITTAIVLLLKTFDVEVDLHSSGKGIFRKVDRSDKMQRRYELCRPKGIKGWDTQAGRITANDMDLAEKLLKNSIFGMYAVLRSSRSEATKLSTYDGNFIFVDGLIAAMPTHCLTAMYEHLRGNWEVYITNGSAVPLRVEVRDVEDYVWALAEGSESEYADLCYVKFSSRLIKQPKPNIISRFISSSDLVVRTRVCGNLIMPMVDPTCNAISFNSKFSVVNLQLQKINSNVAYKDFKFPNSYVYNISTKPGTSGSALITGDTKFPEAKILGLHFGVLGGTSPHAVPMYKESVQEHVDYLKKSTLKVYELLDDYVFDTIPNDIDLQSGGVSMVEPPFLNKTQTFVKELQWKEIKAPRTVNSLKRTKLSKLPGFPYDSNEILSKVCPSVNELREGQNCWAETRLKYEASPDESFNKELYMHCVRKMFEESCHYGWPEEDEKRVYSFREACEGVFGIPSISRGTSAGFPYYMKSPKKYKIFGQNGPFNFDLPLGKIIERTYSEMVEEILLDNSAEHFLYIIDKYGLYFADFPKEETNSKVKCRMISGIPLLLLILERAYQMAYTFWKRKHRIGNRHGIGLNVYTEASICAKHLKISERKNINCDVKGWDTKYPGIMHDGNKLSMDLFYGTDNKDAARVREFLSFTLKNSHHVTVDYYLTPSVNLEGEASFRRMAKAYVYKNRNTQSSGDYTTADLNSDGNNHLQLYMASRILLREKGYDPDAWGRRDEPCPEVTSEVMGNYSSISGGDDFIATVDPSYEMINQQSMQAEYALHGYTLTDDSKSTDLPKFSSRPIFLCRELKRVNGHYHWALERDSVWSRFVFTSNEKQEDDIIIGNFSEAAKELAGRGRREWDLDAPILEFISKEYNLAMPSYESSLDAFRRSENCEFSRGEFLHGK